MSLDKQNWNPVTYARHARFVSDLGMPVVDLLKLRPGERILDLGCGDGALTVRLVELGCDVVGIDASADMVAAARKLGLDARVMDATRLDFDSEFDAVFSNAALHWMPSAGDVIAGVRAALKPGGRFVGEFGGAGNVAAIIKAVNQALRARGLAESSPWYFPTPQQYAQVLESNQFNIESMELFPRPTALPGHIGDWIETFYGPFLDAVVDSAWPDFVDEVCASLSSSLRDADDNWHVDYVRLRFAASLTG
jgi:trans-aconitate methyltransferase